jgi:hypothetical protein
MKTCSVCAHPERASIDAALVGKTSLRIIAGQFGTTKSALDRHRKCIPVSLKQAKQALEVTESTSLLSRIERLMSRMDLACQKATEKQDWFRAIAASRELRGCLELMGKLSGELRPNSTNIAILNGDIRSIDMNSLTDEQLEALCERIDRYEEDKAPQKNKTIQGVR